MIVYILNRFGFHYEIIISIIEKYKSIIKTNKPAQIYLKYPQNTNFTSYIKQYYPNIILAKPESYDYCIDCTLYPKERDRINNDGKHYYICHQVDNSIVSPYVFYLTPLCKTNKYIMCDILPFNKEKIVSTIPIFIVQGNITAGRRNYNLLEKILDYNTNQDYIIKVVGRGKLDEKFNKYKKLITRTNLNFTDFHKEFIDAYCIIPLITRKSHGGYYKNKLTSSINYGLAYNLKFLTDKPLQEIYDLKNCEVFTDENDIVNAFQKTLNAFYAR